MSCNSFIGTDQKETFAHTIDINQLANDECKDYFKARAYKTETLEYNEDPNPNNNKY